MKATFLATVAASVFLCSAIPFIVFADTYGGCSYGSGVYDNNCASQSSGGGSSGGGGGGGGGGSGGGGGGSVGTVSLIISGNPGPASSSTLPVMKKTASSTVIASIAASSSPAYSFRRDLKLGMSGEDVRQLQLYLNKHSFSIAVSGPGSPGAETSYFGRATQAALIRFQKANGIMPAAGYFGPKTRAFIAGPATPTSSSGILLTSDIGPGYVGDEVTELQIFLNTHGFPVAQSGPGSSGNETQDFGPATHAALVRFQDAHAAEILAPLGLTKGSGYLGAATRAYINGL